MEAATARRLVALGRYRILDTPREQDFNEIAALTAAICETPIAVVNLIAEDRQWFKAEVGLGVSETPLEVSFCRHTLAADDDLIVTDATLDPRFDENPLVAGEPHLRFYAGALLRTQDGVAIGTLCVLDYRPRQLTTVQVNALKVLARQVVAQLELRKVVREQHEAAARYRQILASAVDYAIVTTDISGQITSWNEGAERILGWTENEMLGATAHRFFTPEDRAINRLETEMGLALDAGSAPDERWHLRKDGTRIWASGELMPLRGEDGQPNGFLKIVRDRTEARLRDEESRRAERALAVNEQRWRGLFERMREGFFIAEAVRDEVGRVDDLRFLEVNPAFETLTGISADRALGHTLREIVPEVPDAILDRYARVIESGEPDEFEIMMPSLGRHWYEARARRGEAEQVVVMFVDVTQRKAAEARRVALIELGDRLRNLRSSVDIAYVAAEIMGRSMAVSRAGYGIVDPIRETITIERDWNAPGVKSLAGTLQFRDYGSYIGDLKRGETVVVADAFADPRTASTADALTGISARAFVNMPVSEHGAFLGLFYLNHAEGRAWPEEEIAFIRNVADRTRAAIARSRAEERQRLVNRELGHRLKNTLAMVQAIAAQTLRNAPTVKDAQEALGARMIALGKAHDILLSGERESAEIHDLIASAVGIMDDGGPGKFRLSGPELEVGSRAALSLSLILHELGTNATKYGALSTPEGHVDVQWTVSGFGADAIFTLRWSEHGGPPVAEPSRKGFGSRLIARGLTGQIGGQVKLIYAPDGVRCDLSSPLLAFQEDELHPVRTNSLDDD